MNAFYRRWFSVLLLAPLLLPVAWAKEPPPPVSDKPAPEDSEVKQGRDAHNELIHSGIKLVKDPKLTGRVETIGKKIGDAANIEPIEALYGSSRFVRYDYKFFVVDDKDVNAFSLPGGYIYVNRGLLKYVQSDDELAGVLGHEVTHALHHHVSKLQHEQSRLTTQTILGALALILARVPAEATANLLYTGQLFALQRVNGFGQQAEKDADNGGVELARKAGYNPVGALTFMERLAHDEKSRPDIDLGIYRTHPPSNERAQAMLTEIKEMHLPINRREVTNILRLTKVPAPQPTVTGATDLLLDGKLVYRSTSPERIQHATEMLNHLLDTDLLIYEVTRQGTSLVVRGETILTINPDDAALLGATATPETALDQAYNTLRNALFRQALDKSY